MDHLKAPRILGLTVPIKSGLLFMFSKKNIYLLNIPEVVLF